MVISTEIIQSVMIPLLVAFAAVRGISHPNPAVIGGYIRPSRLAFQILRVFCLLVFKGVCHIKLGIDKVNRAAAN